MEQGPSNKNKYFPNIGEPTEMSPIHQKNEAKKPPILEVSPPLPDEEPTEIQNLYFKPRLL